MRAIIQRVKRGAVSVDGEITGSVDNGLVVLIGATHQDTKAEAQKLAQKTAHLRIFEDEAGKMNRSVQDVGGAILLVSNFTLHGDCRKGRRPGFDAAADPEPAKQLYEKVIELITEQGTTVEKGAFGEYMHVSSINDGPINFLLDSSRLF